MYRSVVFWLFCLSVNLLVNSNNGNFTAEPPDHRMEECIAETKADRHSVKRLKAGNWNRSDTTLKKWALCYLVKYDVMSRNAVLNQDVVLRNVPINDKTYVEKIINKCLYKRHTIQLTQLGII